MYEPYHIMVVFFYILFTEHTLVLLENNSELCKYFVFWYLSSAARHKFALVIRSAQYVPQPEGIEFVFKKCIKTSFDHPPVSELILS